MPDADSWLALLAGNSRLHWGWFVGAQLRETWHTPHLDAGAIAQQASQGFAFRAWRNGADPGWQPAPSIWMATVVPQQQHLWQQQPTVRAIALSHVPLQDTYPTLGMDRALAVWGAGRAFGFPVLVVDAGTALTVTGADGDGRLVGGAIAPGFSLQLQMLSQGTAALPDLEAWNAAELPPRWARNTAEAMQSGVVHSLIAGVREFIADWRQRFPQSPVVVTGGGAAVLLQGLSEVRATHVPDLVFWGMASVVCHEGDRL